MYLNHKRLNILITNKVYLTMLLESTSSVTGKLIL